MAAELVDDARSIREGEELDVAAVEAFLKKTLPDLQGTLQVRQFPSGHSNLTYLLQLGDREWVLRRPPAGTKAKTAHDMGREFRMLSALRPVFPYCPEPVAYTEDESIMGCPFYVMERLRGIILRSKLPPGLSFTPAEARTLCERLLDVLVELHRVDYRETDLVETVKPVGYVERQVTGWSRRFRAAHTPDVPDCEEVMAWLADKMPPDSEPPAVVHGDYRFDNVVLDPADPLKIIGVLDWEMATVGDPLMDLGNALAYWIQADDPPEMQAIKLMPTDMDGALVRDELVARYAEKSGRTIDSFDFYYCFGLFRLAVIAQQIYYRFYHGQTKDPRFQMFAMGVMLLDQAARRVIEASPL